MKNLATRITKLARHNRKFIFIFSLVVIVTIGLIVGQVVFKSKHTTSKPPVNIEEQEEQIPPQVNEPMVNEVSEIEPMINPPESSGVGIVYPRRGSLNIYKDGEISTLLEHKGKVGDFAISSDSKFVAYTVTTGCKDCRGFWPGDGIEIYLYDTEQELTKLIYEVKDWKTESEYSRTESSYADRISLFGFTKDSTLLFWHKSLYAYNTGTLAKKPGMDLGSGNETLEYNRREGKIIGEYIYELSSPGEGGMYDIYKINPDKSVTKLSNKIAALTEYSYLGSYIQGTVFIDLKGNILRLLDPKLIVSGTEDNPIFSYENILYKIDLAKMKLLEKRKISNNEKDKLEFQCPINYMSITIECDSLPKLIRDSFPKNPFLIDRPAGLGEDHFVFMVSAYLERDYQGKVGLVEYKDGKLRLVDSFKPYLDAKFYIPNLQKFEVRGD